MNEIEALRAAGISRPERMLRLFRDEMRNRGIQADRLLGMGDDLILDMFGADLGRVGIVLKRLLS